MTPPEARALQRSLRRLLDELARQSAPLEMDWQAWRIQPVQGGANGLLFRASGPLGDYAIKFTRRDERDRAGREFAALQVLAASGRRLGPHPVLLVKQRYAHAVIVQTWVEGEVSPALPESDQAWLALVEHYAQVHTLTPQTVSQRLKPGVLNYSCAAQGRQSVRQQIERLPQAHRPPVLVDLCARLEAARFPRWPVPPVALCRVDANLRNFIRRAEGWLSVDWENSGWGDPAFEMADLALHPAYLGVSDERWDWVLDQYVRLHGDPSARQRIEVYRRILGVWWVARLARYLYEMPRQLDVRLAAWPEGWEEDIQAKLAYYSTRAQQAWS